MSRKSLIVRITTTPATGAVGTALLAAAKR